ncbi:hypothetical protein TthSNM11_10180 [Thermus thermophilus]|nr:hypothetical protein TthSNM11_10180 [Thermus thermophilus]
MHNHRNHRNHRKATCEESLDVSEYTALKERMLLPERQAREEL